LKKIGVGLFLKQDNTNAAMKAIRELSRTSVMVGIPEEKAERDPSPDDPNPPTNAVLGYIHEHGDPSKNLPARPFLAPGVAASQEQWEESLETAAILAFRGDAIGMRAALGRAGARAVAAVQAVIRAQDFAALAPSTVEERLRKIGVIRPKLISKYNKMSASEQAAFVAENITILMDTGAMFRSITWVLREEGSSGIS
jgi:hypothetical protein